MIKAFSIAAAVTALATTSFAGSLDTIVEVEPEDVFVAATPSSAGIGVPLAIAGGVLAIGALIANDNDDDDNDAAGGTGGTGATAGTGS